MLFSNKIKTFFYLTIFTLYHYSIPQSEYKQTPEQETTNTSSTAHQNSNTDISEKDHHRDLKFLLNLQKEMFNTNRIVTDLLSLVKSGQITASKKTVATLTFMMNFTQLSQTDKLFPVPITKDNAQQYTYSLLQANKVIIESLLKALSYTFNNLPTYYQEYATANIKRSRLDTSPEELHALHQENIELYDQLSQKLIFAGLKWYNIAYRALDDTVIEPMLQNDLHVYLSTFGIGAFGVLTTYWALKNEDFHSSSFIPECIKRIFGTYPNPNNRPEREDPRYTLFGLALYYFIRPSSLTSLGFLSQTPFFSYPAGTIRSKWEKTIKPALTKYGTILRNTLKGGLIHQAIAKKLANIVEPVYFSDLVGADAGIKEFKKIVEYMKDPEISSRVGVTIDKGYMLAGPPRSGKTHLCRALQGELAKIGLLANFIEVKHADVYYRKGIDQILKEAKEMAPCIIFIDEIDLYNLQRSGGSNSNLSSMLTGMSGLTDNNDPKKLVIIIAATNKPEMIDFALKSPGRFGTEIRFELPSYEVRKQVLQQTINKLMIQLPNSQEVIDCIARQTEGANFENLKQLVIDAFTVARYANEPCTKAHFEKALNSGIRKIVPHLDKAIPAHEQQLLATHLAGKALAVTLLNTTTKLALVTTHPYMPAIKEEVIYKVDTGNGKKEDDHKQSHYEYGKVFTYQEKDSMGIQSKESLIAQCKADLAGIVAEELIFGSASYTCNAKDMENALQIATKFTFEGVNKEFLPKGEHDKRFSAAVALVEQYKKETHALLSANRNKLMLLATTLQEKKQLNQEEVMTLLSSIS